MRHTFMFRSVLIAVLLAVCTVASAKGPKVPYTHPGMTENDRTHENAVNWVSVADIEKSLQGKRKMTVGFDIDENYLDLAVKRIEDELSERQPTLDWADAAN